VAAAAAAAAGALLWRSVGGGVFRKMYGATSDYVSFRRAPIRLEEADDRQSGAGQFVVAGGNKRRKLTGSKVDVRTYAGR